MRRFLFGTLLAAVVAGAPKDQTDVFTAMICPAGDQRPRNTEADVVKLKDGSLLLGYSEFVGSDASDFAQGRIAGKISLDGGRTWSEPFVILHNDGKMNTMSPSFLRLRSGKLAMSYNVKNSQADNRVLFRTSTDEGKTWGAPVKVNSATGYWGINNARLVQLKSGRVLAPLWFVNDWNQSHHTRDAVAYSDDEGQTWRESEIVDVPQGRRGADEPGVVELRDGKVLMIIRTDMGKIYRSYSSDAGAHWTAAEATVLDSPTAPAAIARIPVTGDLLLLWNNRPPGPTHMQDRFPLASAISRDEGQTWEHIRNLDATPGFSYSYASITFPERDRAIITYYASQILQGDRRGGNHALPGEGAERHVFSLKEKIVPAAWFYGKSSLDK
jgi:Neuraminidase (sialidase)